MRRSWRILRALPGALRRAPRRLRTLAPRDLVSLVASPLLLPVLAVALRRHGVQQAQARLLRRRPTPRSQAPERLRAEAERLAWCAEVGAKYGPWPANCLQRSLLVWWYLQRRGLGGELRIGVRRDPDAGGLAFHAWVEREGVPVNDQPDIRRRYATFEQAIVPPTARFR